MSKLFTPIRLGDLQIPNRIAVSPMCQYSCKDGVPQFWHSVHVGNLMLSGAGLVILEATGVEAAGRITHGCLGLYTNAQETALTDLVANVRSLSGAAIGIQLAHAGRKASSRSIADRWKGEPLPPEEGAWKLYSPSAVAFGDGWPEPCEMTEADIERVIQAFADAARRAHRANFDLVEIHGAHGYLLHSFLSPLANKRTDGWGGSLENRMRFPLEVTRAIRAVWPRAKALGFRMTATDWAPEGLTLDDAVTFAKELEKAGVNYAVMSTGSITPSIKIPPATPGYQVEFATKIKESTGLVAMAVGMITSSNQAEDILADQKADMVAVGRAILDNPRWGLHAAAELGVDLSYTPQYIRIKPNNWSGFKSVHPKATVGMTKLQLDRPPKALHDRPQEPVLQGT